MMKQLAVVAIAAGALAASTSAAEARQASTSQAQSQTAPPPPPPPVPPRAPASAPTPAPINLNTATLADLEKLPGVGPAVAARIIEHRQKNGPFKKIEDLMNIRGIGEKSFLRLKPLVTIAPPKVTER